MKIIFIYTLTDPFTGLVRYVGKSTNPDTRFRAHLCRSGFTKDHRSCWIAEVLKRGKKPILEVVDSVPENEWPQWEVAWIAFYREQGFDLTNATNGGEGASGHVFSEQHKARLRASLTGNKNSLGNVQTKECIAKRVAVNLGNKYGLGYRHSEDSRKKMSLSRLGRVCPKISEANKKRTQSCDTRAKISQALLGNKNTLGFVHSEETRVKRSEASKLMWQKRKAARLVARADRFDNEVKTPEKI